MSAHTTTFGTIADGFVQTISPELLLQEMRSDVPLVVVDVGGPDSVLRGMR